MHSQSAQEQQEQSLQAIHTVRDALYLLFSSMIMVIKVGSRLPIIAEMLYAAVRFLKQQKVSIHTRWRRTFSSAQLQSGR